MNEEQAREIAIQILDEFEELLAAKGIKIPSDDREGRKEEARLYGEEYWRLEDNIVQILMERWNARMDGEDADNASSKVRQLAIRICDEFEELLAEKDIVIPSTDRTGEAEEACLYGSEYYALEDAVVAILLETNQEREQPAPEHGIDDEARRTVKAMQTAMANAPIGFVREQR